MDESPKGKIKASQVIIAILVVIALLQAFALIHQGRRQTALEREQKKYVMLDQNLTPGSTSHARHRARALPSAFPRSVMDEDPWQDFDAMSQRMGSLIQHAFMFGSPLFQSMPEGTGFDFTPAVDLEETKDAYIVKSDLPGLEKDKINLTVQENVLTIEGVRQVSNEMQDSKQGYYAQERSYGSFARSLSLPGPVDEARIEATYKNGVLTITLPKTAGQKDAQKVAIQ